MIERTQLTGRTRPYPLPDVLRAIIRVTTAPGSTAPDPRQMNWPHAVAGDEVDPSTWPAAMLGLQTGHVAGVAAWAAALTVHQITVIAEPSQTMVSVVGRTSYGPVVSVYDFVRDWPLGPVSGSRDITADELAAVAAAVADVARTAEALAGAR